MLQSDTVSQARPLHDGIHKATDPGPYVRVLYTWPSSKAWVHLAPDNVCISKRVWYSDISFVSLHEQGRGATVQNGTWNWKLFTVSYRERRVAVTRPAQWPFNPKSHPKSPPKLAPGALCICIARAAPWDGT